MGSEMCIRDRHGGHRALADIIESIDELRYYRDMMFVSAPGPSESQAKAGAQHIESTSLLRDYERRGEALEDVNSAEKRDY